MCGIAGFYNLEDKKLAKSLSQAIEHRGPDGEGVYDNEKVTLINRRLAIIDLKSGDQPIFNEDKSIVTVYNGEIYNYKELRKDLESKGHTFKTLSDTEVIVHGYEEWGVACFERFNGMFGVAVYDIKKEQLVLARDHFGIKPLYFTLLPKNQLIFSSEIKPILESGYIAKKPTEKVLYRYLKYRIHDDSPETFFENIYRLMPGQALIIKKGDLQNVYFSKLEEELKDLASHSDKQALTQDNTEQFKSRLFDAIRLRLISDVPVGTCLSGGLDSSTVVSVVNRLINENILEAKSVGKIQNTFSAVFPSSANDEEKYIDAVISSVKTKIKSLKVHPKPEQLFEEMSEFIRAQEEPTISTGPYAQFCVMREAKKHVKVLLDGQGADEMMAGYLPYYFVYLRQLKKQKKFGRYLLEILSSLDVVSKYVGLSLRAKFRRFNSDRLFNKGFFKKHRDQSFTPIKDNLKLRLVQDIFYNSLQSLLRYEDRNSMHFSIEGRVPYLDFNVVRFLFSLSDTAIIKNGWNKNILRKSASKLLPKLITTRRNKIGFTTPEEEWFMRMKNRIYSIFLSPSFGERPYFNQEQVLKGFQKFIEGKTSDTLLFWRILNVELWLREFIDPPSNKTSENKARQIDKDIEAEGKKFTRELIRSELFAKGDDFSQKISHHVISSKLASTKSKWFVVVSEKVVAISQGRSYFIWDIKTGFWSKLLSKYVTKTPYGIGLGSPWTMQLAIQEIGLPKVLFASIAAAVTKPFGKKGVFYEIVGEKGRSIDGPTEYSLYPSNVSAKLAPKDPQNAAREIDQAIREDLKLSEEKQFDGVVIIDANDIGQNVLGNTTSLPDNTIAQIFRDNPMGQGSEQTPITIVLS